MIGERLEEARKRKGISVREAAEATKIRGEYLISMEDNTFDIALPNVYIRGFLKNYARFLNLDPDKILTDFDAQQLGRSQAVAPPPSGQEGQQRSYGHMELQQEEEEGSEEAQTSEASGFHYTDSSGIPQSAQKHPAPSRSQDKAHTLEHDSWSDSKTLYLKVGVVFGGLVVLAVTLILLIRLVTSDSPPEINPELADSQKQTEQASSEETQATTRSDSNTASSSTSSEPQEHMITLRAADTVTVIVEQTIDRERIFSGTLNAGESVTRERLGPVSIRFTNGSALTVESAGQTYQPNQTGVGRTVID